MTSFILSSLYFLLVTSCALAEPTHEKRNGTPYMVLLSTVGGYASESPAAGAADNDVVNGVENFLQVRVVRFTSHREDWSFRECTGNTRGKVLFNNRLFQALSPRAQPSVSMELVITDCLGQIVYSAHGEETISLQASAGLEGALKKNVVAAGHMLMRTLSETVRKKRQPLLKNLQKYGIGLTNKEKVALFSLAPSAGGAVASTVVPAGTAASAGLRIDDLVTSVNGHPLMGVTQEQLDTLLAGTDMFELKALRGTRS